VKDAANVCPPVNPQGFRFHRLVLGLKSQVFFDSRCPHKSFPCANAPKARTIPQVPGIELEFILLFVPVAQLLMPVTFTNPTAGWAVKGPLGN